MVNSKKLFPATVIYLASLLLAYVFGQIFERSTIFAAIMVFYMPISLGIYVHVITATAKDIPQSDP